MLIIEVKDGGIERALKELKKKFTKMKTIKDLRDRQSFTKKSIKRRTEINKAKYIQSLRQES